MDGLTLYMIFVALVLVIVCIKLLANSLTQPTTTRSSYDGIFSDDEGLDDIITFIED